MKVRTVEELMAALAASAHGVVTRAQLLGAGISASEIQQRVKTGALRREHRAVYRVGHRAPSVDATYMAAVLACGEGAMLRGRAAGHHIGILKGTPPAPEVATPTERRVAGVKTKRERRIDRRDVITWRGIRVTSVPRTLVDLAAVLPPDDLARACHEAGVRYRTTPTQVEAVLTRRPRSPGAANLRAVLRGDTPVTLSALEKRFLELLNAQGLPTPTTNKPAGSKRVDCRWPHHRLTVELDSYRYHSSRHAWEQDRRREREARARGDEFRRYTHGDVFLEPGLMLAELSSLLVGQWSRRK